ncbi:putative oxidoreductase [Lindgomyces ingoldianus]|uniref:Oxidoreductase n=1 Tax=Lindgomyces ingoldianus TaxID=673940 RepID=A0ACB6Q6L8_9PLEO|nr:putative oxidoreductase [Lindgomyces ingoldianus]KAF2462584.1 putative oxidoreductase [Lindgomyces ingoldianus]
MAPRLIFGTATFGMDLTEFQNQDSVNSLLRTLRGLGVERLDSGARYPPLNPGRSEMLIGDSKEFCKGFIIDTKVYTNTQTDGSGDLTRAGISKSLTGSLQRLQINEGINVLYAHRADPSTPLEEQIQGFIEQIAQGRCKSWGVSNTPPKVLERILQLCEENGWAKPSCYQGNYNLVTRGMETNLLPTLRENGIAFNCFQPLAAGFLTGKLVNKTHAGTRFDKSNPLGNIIQKMFESVELQDAMKVFDAGVRAEGLAPMEVALRWLANHSVLNNGDGIIFGASKVDQAPDTVRFLQSGPLPPSVLILVENLWAAVKEMRGDII